MRTKGIKEWVGKNDDSAIPDTIRRRVKMLAKDLCKHCGNRIRFGGEVDHVIALANWNPTEEKPHGNRESNLQYLCKNCHKPKTARDVAEKSRTAKANIKLGSLKRKRKGFWGWRKFDGTLVHRSDGDED
jgi:5-methylcytosine-specific restriction protein A